MAKSGNYSILSGGVSTTFQWNRKTGRGYRDGMLEWFVPPSTLVKWARTPLWLNLQRMRAIPKIWTMAKQKMVATASCMMRFENPAIDFNRNYGRRKCKNIV